MVLNSIFLNLVPKSTGKNGTKIENSGFGTKTVPKQTLSHYTGTKLLQRL
ncbi:hypothetical protein ABGF28_05520 [Helcococcus ovis]